MVCDEKVVTDLRKQLNLNAAALQVPIGLEDAHKGVVDLLLNKAFLFEGDRGEKVTEGPVPDNLKEMVAEKRTEMIERLAEVGHHLLLDDLML